VQPDISVISAKATNRILDALVIFQSFPFYSS
jgi:hypothetical protein